MAHSDDPVTFDPAIAVALARAAGTLGVSPRPEVKERLMARLQSPPLPDGFVIRSAMDADWVPHPVPGIRMKVLAVNRRSGYATLLLDVAPGTRFPPHHHEGAEECYVLAGSLHTCGRQLNAGDFIHADADTDHGELWTEEGCQVLLVVPPEDELSDRVR